MVRSERGAAAIEFALVLPVLLLLLIGMIEFSILLYNKAMITNASREGARAGVVWTDGARLDEDEIEAIVNNYAAANVINFDPGNTLTTTAVHDDADGEADVDPGELLTVTVSYDYGFLVLPNFLTSLSDVFTLTAETIMRYE